MRNLRFSGNYARRNRKMLIWGLLTSLFAACHARNAKEPSNPSGRARTARPCKNDMQNVARGHSIASSLYCHSGFPATTRAVASRLLPNGCLADTFILKCGADTRTLVVEPGAEPTIPSDLFRVDPGAISDYQEAHRNLTKDPTTALAAINRALEKEKRIGQWWRVRGLAYVQLGRLEDALADFDTVLARTPTEPLFRLEHAQIAARGGRQTQAIAELIAIDHDTAANWANKRELAGTLAHLASEAGHPDAPVFRARACAEGVTSYCAELRPDASTR